MADTPRVTVPVEPIQRLILAADSYGVRYLDSDDMSAEAEELQAATEAMKDLIAASAPEGGAVTDALQRLRVLRDQARNGTAVSDPDEYDADEFDAILSVIEPALATREEAPAEAAPACLEIPLSNHMRVTLEYDPDGSRTATLWNEANEPIADGDAPNLRAQPQAREDAQPVADEVLPVAWVIRTKDGHIRMWTMSEARARTAAEAWGMEAKQEGLSPVTHPAPDALRVAVEAIIEQVKTGAHGSTVQALGALSNIEQIALASLQAEQGAK